MIRKLMLQFQALERETDFIAVPDDTDASVWTVGVTTDILRDAGLKALCEPLSTWANQVNEPVLLQLEMRFPSQFPSEPPFVRILKPRFVMHTGHITIGGSICADFLTSHKWDPTLSLEALLRSVLCLMTQGNGRIDINSKYSYTLHEAKEAFQRMLNVHGWQ